MGWLSALDCSSGGSSKQQQQLTQAAGGVGGGGNSRLSPLPAHKGIRKLTSFRNRSPTGQSPINKTRKPSQTDQIPSPKTKTWKGRVAKQLRRIQQGSGSPSSPTAPNPEGVTIGIPLEDCPQSSFSEFVPLLVELCTNIVELRGLDIIGIYRVPGNTAAVSSLTEGVNKGFDSINLQDPRWNDVNVISSLLKLFFRRLPDALLTSELYPLFIEADKIEDPGKRIVTIKKLLHDLPDHHFETLKFLLLHLKKVVEHSTTNKMEARNLAIVFGPTLVRTADDNMVTMVTDMSHQCRIVESLISHVDWFFSDDESDDFSNFPFSFPQDSAELEPASANHNLLLSNIQKVEGMKADSPNKDICAKDIVSSIISAANRKMQKAKSRKGGGSSGSGTGVEDCKETSGEVRENTDIKQHTLESKSKRKESVSAFESGDQPTSTVASSIYESVVFSGNIVKSIHTGENEDSAAPSEAACIPDHSLAHDSGGGEMQAEGRFNKPEGSRKDEQQQQPLRQDGGSMPGSDEGTIRTYAGLSATTQERIRRFERETKAMLQRDLTRQRRDTEWREADKKRIEIQLQQAKRDMESEDFLDEIADNPSDITKKISGINSILEHDKKYSVSDNSNHASSIGCKLSSSSLLSSSVNSNNLTSSTKSESSSLTSLTCQSNLMTSSKDQGNTQTKVGLPWSPVDRSHSSTLQKFTQTKKVGTTHIFPDNQKKLGRVENGSVTSSSSSSADVVAVSTSASLLPGRPDTEGTSNKLSGSNLLTHSSVTTTLPSSAQHVLQHGKSAENLHASAQQHTNTRFDAQKGAPPPNGTLKKFKTGKEQLELVPPVLSSQPPSPLTGSLRCGSLDSLQEAYSSELPHSDISDDGGCFFSWTRKILAINKKISRQAASPSLWCFLSHLHPQTTFISKPSSTTTATGSPGCPINSSSSTAHHHHHYHHAGLKFAPSEALGRLRRGSDLLVSLTSTFDRKLKSLLSATTAAAATTTTLTTAVEAVTDATTATEIKASNRTQEPSKLPQEKENAASSSDDKSSVSAVGSSEISISSLLEASTVTSTNTERISIQPAGAFTTTATTIFRDPSLHRRKSASAACKGQKHDAVGKDEDKQVETKKQDYLVRGRSRESSSVSSRKSFPHLEQKSLHGGKNCEKKNENDGTVSDNLKKVANDRSAVARPKSIDSVTKSEKTESSHSSRLRRSESLTKSEKEEGSAASIKLKRSESLTKADKQETTAVNSRLKRSESLTKAEKSSETTLANTKLRRSESLSKAERTETSSNTKLRRSESLTKAERLESPSNTKLKRSDSLTKTEKTESNISKRRQQEIQISSSGFKSSSRGNKEKENIATILTKLKRKNGMPERSIKRRHTVGGTKDFDKLHWLDNRLQHEQLAENEAASAVSMTTVSNKERRCLRTSSPDLSSSRLSGILAQDGFLFEISLLGSGGIMAELRQHLSPVTGRPHSLPDPNLASRVFKVPLESHV
ncbi:Rho GTPase-activating protein 21 [Zootermopsis nevadensis]|uniref:Rho GTPase-activating protein 21 n=1 Tax=Zootermopsis nevadensis TaxID=136037 RepID=A0A067RK53_ZOONE|nr:Rho GTPase-activating protein 21 [Zootermopsis nevadensis]